MVFTAFQIFEFVINLSFALLSIFILATFFKKFKGNKKQPNVLGFIFMAAGLSLHIIGRTSEALFIDTIGHNIHLLATLISIAVTTFILGSILIAYHNSEDKKPLIKKIAIAYTIISTSISMTHILVWLNVTTQESFSDIELFFFLFEMTILSIVYVLMFIQSNKSVRKATAVRLKLMSSASIGFVIVILVDTLLQLGYLEVGQLSLFVTLFLLHVLTVGSFYLLVIFPDWFKEKYAS